MKNCLYPFGDVTPTVDETVFIAEGAKVVGRVEIGEHSNVWFNAVIRGDLNDVKIGTHVNIQDNCIIHSTVALDDQPHNSGVATIGDYCTIGHGAIVHACTVEDHCLIGMNAVVLDYAVIGRGSIIGTGAVVKKGDIIPPFSLVLGVPGRVVKTLADETLGDRHSGAEEYCELAKQHIASR